MIPSKLCHISVVLNLSPVCTTVVLCSGPKLGRVQLTDQWSLVTSSVNRMHSSDMAWSELSNMDQPKLPPPASGNQVRASYGGLGKVNRPTIFFLSGFYCSRGEDLVHQKRKYFHET